MEAGLRNTIQKRNAPASVANAVKTIGCLLWRGLYDASMVDSVVLLKSVVDGRGCGARGKESCVGDRFSGRGSIWRNAAYLRALIGN